MPFVRTLPKKWILASYEYTKCKRFATRTDGVSNPFNKGYVCAGCHSVLTDKYVLKASGLLWHTECLRCVECKVTLQDKCFFRNGNPLCQTDFFRRYGTKCSVCDVGIAPSETVQRALGRVYHLACFTCLVCHKELSTGDRFYLTKEGKVLCKDDYEIKSREKDALTAVAAPDNSKSKRPRTFIGSQQLNALKSAYEACPRPAFAERERISQLTGLDMRVVQVWFQNRRAKDKRQNKANLSWFQRSPKSPSDERKPNHFRSHTWSPGTLALPLDLISPSESILMGMKEAGSQESLTGELQGLYLDSNEPCKSPDSAAVCQKGPRFNSFLPPYLEINDQNAVQQAQGDDVMRSQNLPLGFSFASSEARKEPPIPFTIPFPMNESFLLNIENPTVLPHQQSSLMPKAFVNELAVPDSFQPRQFGAVGNEVQSKKEPEQME